MDSSEKTETNGVVTPMSDAGVPLTAAEQRQLKRRVGFLGLAFAIVFTGFNVVQSFVTTIFGSIGFTILLVLYSFFGISALLAPTLTSHLSRFTAQPEKLGMILGAASYIVFMVTVAVKLEWMVILGAAVNGMGAGLLWINQV